MSYINSLISDFKEYLSTLHSNFNIYTPSDFIRKSGNFTLPYMLINLNGVNLEQHSGCYSMIIGLNVEFYIKTSETVNDGGTTKRDIEAVYYYGETLLDEIAKYNYNNNYYIINANISEIPITPVNEEEVIGGVITIQLGGIKEQ